ncbi:hypothetical protein N9V47_09265 [Luminiphilus sp.]|nr:hypothetical protein [Luminiphilus sp.]
MKAIFSRPLTSTIAIIVVAVSLFFIFDARIQRATVKHVPSVVGDWSLKTPEAAVTISVDESKNGLLRVFLLSGNPLILHPSINRQNTTSGRPLTQEFYARELPQIEANLDITAENGHDGDTVSRLNLTVPISLRLDETLTVETSENSFLFERDSPIDVAINFVRMLIEALVAFLLLCVFSLLGLAAARHHLVKLFSAKRDRRYTNRSHIRGGGTFWGVIASGFFWVFCIFLSYAFATGLLAGLFGMSTFSDYLYFFTY